MKIEHEIKKSDIEATVTLTLNGEELKWLTRVFGRSNSAELDKIAGMDSELARSMGLYKAFRAALDEAGVDYDVR